MNKGHFKDSQVVKGITIGAVLIVIYLALNNVTGILDSISYLAGLVMPFIIGAVIAFVFNVPMKAIEKGLNRLFDKRCKKKHPRLIRVLAYMLTLILILAIIAGVLFVVVPELVNTIADLIGQVPTAVNNLINWLQVKLSAYPEYEEKLSSISINWDSVLSNVMNFLSIGTKGIINGGIGAISGFVSGITNFGAFVDLDDNQTGLVHISQISDRFIKDIHDVLSVGDTVTVKVMKIGSDGKIALSMKEAQPKEERHHHEERENHREQGHGFHERRHDEEAHGHAHTQERHEHREFNHAPQRGFSGARHHRQNDSFDNMLASFMKESESRLSTLKRQTDGKRGGRGGRRS